MSQQDYEQMYKRMERRKENQLCTCLQEAPTTHWALKRKKEKINASEHACEKLKRKKDKCF